MEEGKISHYGKDVKPFLNPSLQKKKKKISGGREANSAIFLYQQRGTRSEVKISPVRLRDTVPAKDRLNQENRELAHYSSCNLLLPPG